MYISKLKDGNKTYIAYGKDTSFMDVYLVIADGKAHREVNIKWPNMFRFRPEYYWDLVTVPKKITMEEINKKYGRRLQIGEMFTDHETI